MIKRITTAVVSIVIVVVLGVVCFSKRSHALWVFNASSSPEHLVVDGEKFDAPPGQLLKREVKRRAHSTIGIDDAFVEIATNTGMDGRTFIIDASPDVGYVLVDLSSLYYRKKDSAPGAEDQLAGLSIKQASPAGEIAHAFAAEDIDSGPGEEMPTSQLVMGKGTKASVTKLFRVYGRVADSPDSFLEDVRRALREHRSLVALEALR